MNQINILKNILKTEGLRYTQQRQIIWDEIRKSKEHRDAEEIYLIIKKKNAINVSRATVYRTIDVLVKNNLVRKMEHPPLQAKLSAHSRHAHVLNNSANVDVRCAFEQS